MSNVRIPRGLSATIARVLRGSHADLDALFLSAGAPGPPPDLSHQSKWKTWIFQAGNDPQVDSLRFLGDLLEEFMDCPPWESELHDEWVSDRSAVIEALEESGFRYFRGGRVLPNDSPADPQKPAEDRKTDAKTVYPSSINELLTVLVRGLPRAMHPLTHRRKGAQSLRFGFEYDVQDLLHALLRPWVGDIRPEEFTPSYAGSSTVWTFCCRLMVWGCPIAC